MTRSNRIAVTEVLSKLDTNMGGVGAYSEKRSSCVRCSVEIGVAAISEILDSKL